jgi:hypothetical protein
MTFVQENNLQQLKLPQPVMCIGGMMLLELFERDHKQEKHNLLYVSQIFILPLTCTH